MYISNWSYIETLSNQTKLNQDAYCDHLYNYVHYGFVMEYSHLQKINKSKYAEELRCSVPAKTSIYSIADNIKKHIYKTCFRDFLARR